MATTRQNVPTYLTDDEWERVRWAARQDGHGRLSRWIRSLILRRADELERAAGELHTFGRPCGADTGKVPTTDAIRVEQITCARCRRMMGGT